MQKIYPLYLLIILLCAFGTAHAQERGTIQGTVATTGGEPLPNASIVIERTTLGASSNEDGAFKLESVPAGRHTLEIRMVGFQPLRLTVEVLANRDVTIEAVLHEDNLNLSEVVVSATRYGVDRKKAPVIVNVLSPRIFNATQSVAMSETLNFQPGVRVETNCQNCGFSQVRLNGLEGAYSQILINSRPVFSALNSVYGLDQIPTSMVDRIEVVRSGGSALFGSNAIAGTINVITKDPVENTWEIGNNISLIGGSSWDNTINFNASIVEEDLQSGVTFYGMNRNRQAYDANGDGFSEVTKLRNNTFGGKAFLNPTELNRLTLDLSAMNEFRRGGDRLHLSPHFTDITEQLEHTMLMGGLTFDQYSRDYANKFSVYISGQGGKRNSYYGGLAGSTDPIDSLIAANSYGTTDDLSLVGGMQFTRNFDNDVFTTGTEYQHNNTQDEIAGYDRLVDQRTNNFGVYAQYEWKPSAKLTTLLGARYDHVMVDGRYHLRDLDRRSDVSTGAFSPRLTILYNLSDDLQFRGGYARGFRAPQAFNEDMHVSSVRGEQVFTMISDSLDTEYSNAYTASLNYTRNFGNTQINLLLEGFLTDLRSPFTNVLTNELDGVLLEEVRNGSGAYVTGGNVELSIAPSSSYSLSAGGTLQRSKYREAQELFAGDDQNDAVFVNRFVRAPNVYGYLNSNWKVTDDFALDVTGVYTGSMIAPHVVDDTEFIELKKTPDFMELNLRLGYTFRVRSHFNIELSSGVQNMFNSYQRDFDSGPRRDQDYVYGPSRPRTYFLALKIGHFH